MSGSSPNDYAYERPGRYLKQLDAQKRRQGFISGVLVTLAIVAGLAAAAYFVFLR